MPHCSSGTYHNKPLTLSQRSLYVSRLLTSGNVVLNGYDGHNAGDACDQSENLFSCRHFPSRQDLLNQKRNRDRHYPCHHRRRVLGASPRRHKSLRTSRAPKPGSPESIFSPGHVAQSCPKKRVSTNSNRPPGAYARHPDDRKRPVVRKAHS
jgi:hypothetical protein